VLSLPTRPEPWLYRADRVPTAMRGGWKPLRHIAGPADLGLSAVAMNNTIWMLRSDSATGFNVDWQPVATENNEQLAPPGPTINLGPPSGTREAAGVTATKDAIYVFGGKSLPFEVLRIALVNGGPTPAQKLTSLRYAREGATALVHGSTVYLVGGNTNGGPAIERAPILRDGTLGAWESFPEPPAGAPIKTALFARDYLWIFREDGSLQKSRIGLSAIGHARAIWDADTRPRVVTRGETVQIPIKWSYDGPRELMDLSAAVSGSFVDNHVKPLDPISRLLDPVSGTPGKSIGFGNLTLSPDPLGGQDRTVGTPFTLSVTIPNDPLRSEYMSLVQLYYQETIVDQTGATKKTTRSLGPVLRFRFVIKRTL